MAEKTIIYLTDGSLDEALATRVREILVREAGAIPIVSVSQRPVDLGRNVCLGEIGRSWMSLYSQILAGIDACDTPYIGIAEHDCLYSHEHLAWTPPSDGVFFYNFNCWLVQWGGNHPELDGMYSYWPKRYALSQLVCRKELLKQSTEEVMNLLQMGFETKKGMRWYGEPGLARDTYKAYEAAVSDKPIQLQRYLKDYLTKYTSEPFKTEIPNLDIRHGSNFTGPKRGNQKTYELPYWGRFAEVIGG